MWFMSSPLTTTAKTDLKIEARQQRFFPKGGNLSERKAAAFYPKTSSAGIIRLLSKHTEVQKRRSMSRAVNRAETGAGN